MNHFAKPTAVSEERYKDTRILITSQELEQGRWQSSFSAGGFDAISDPADSLAESRKAALEMAELMIDRWLG